MRRIATVVLFAILTPWFGAAAASGPADCCPMGGDMSCCPARDAADAGCGLRRCSTDGSGSVAQRLRTATIEAPSVRSPMLEWQPLFVAGFDSSHPLAPDPETPPPRA